MSIYAELDENGKVVHRELSDRKKCLTFAEWKYILENTRIKDHQYLSGTDMQFVDGKCVRYFWCKFNHYSAFPLTVAEIHSKYGRGVDVTTVNMGLPNVELRIRAYHDFR